MDEDTLDSIFNKICSRLEQESKVANFSLEFSKLTTDEERIKFVAPFLNDINFTPTTETTKCDKKAKKLREDGNKHFNKKNDNTALTYYTKSVAVASHAKPCEALAYAYANRSAVLKVSGLYEESIIDIDRAFEIGYPPHLSYKLHTRQGQCYAHLKQKDKAIESFVKAKSAMDQSDLPDDKKKELLVNIENDLKKCKDSESISELIAQLEIKKCAKPKKSYGQNEEIPCASDCITIEYSNTMGRHVVATRDILPGDVIIVEPPYACVLLPKFSTSHCNHCLRRYAALLPCPSCSWAMFCGEECQTAAQKYHKYECRAMPLVKALDMGKMSLLAVRVLTLAMTSERENLIEDTTRAPVVTEVTRTLAFDDEGRYSSTDFAPIYHLVANTSLRSVPDMFKRSIMAACLTKCLRVEMMLYGGLLLRLLQNLPCNAHEVSEMCKASKERYAYNEEIGAAAYATLSLLNHSCDPNVVRHSHGTWAVLRAIKTIPKGSQIEDNYGFHFAVHPKYDRQVHLKNQYLFTCTCEACENDWPLHKNLPELVEGQKGLKDTLKEVMKCGAVPEATAVLLAEHLAELDKSGGRLSKEYNSCQEAIKQSFAQRGNYYCFKS